MVGLGAALVSAVVLIALPPADRQPVSQSSTSTLAEVWPDAQRADIPVGVSDGPAYSPVYFRDVRTSLGTAPNPEGTHLRLVARAADGALRELRRLPLARSPQFGGFAIAGDQVAWAESTADADGRGRTELWAVDLASERPARRLTTDTGDLLLFNSEYDMVIDNNRLYWAAGAPGEESATEVRSVSLAGGPVSVRTEPGAWAMSAWPWLVSAGSGISGPVRLYHLEERRTVDVDAGTDLVSCSPTWCRALVRTDGGESRIDLMRPDGSDRRQIAGGAASASVIDVAILDRFEVLSLSDAQRTVTDTQQLLLYDVQRRQTVLVAEGVGMVLCRDGVLWWSTGGTEIVAWHTLDLRTLR
ncbi:hypothetical protein GCM10027290_22550 [Micromonospora sonneratiae]